MAQTPQSKKLQRLRAGHAPRVLDLFAGCGGLSLGFQAAGFKIAGAVELDEIAATSHARNFFRAGSRADWAHHAEPRDITATEPVELARELHLGTPESAIDVIVGGPPCQAFARVGRAKLREVAEHPEAFRQDPRGNLYLRYLTYVRAFKPLALLVENVPDMLNYAGHNIAEEMCEVLEETGYRCAYTLLNAAYYGVPQMRERAFLIAYAKEIRKDVRFPNPTHWISLPRGYEGTRRVALKAVQSSLFEGFGHFVKPPEPTPELAPAITAREALQDLPPITDHLTGKLRRGTRRFTQLAEYRSDIEPSPFALLMRTWPGFESERGVLDHVIRSLPRDYNIFRVMLPGDQYPQAYQHACRLFDEAIARGNRRLRPGQAAYEELRRAIVPPYDPGKFPNKWRKMEADLPARTLMAHLGKDSYSHIHYESEQARTISVREAARLQSFPDGFVFEGTMNPAFRQIGNAVPPVLSYVLARTIRRALGLRKQTDLLSPLLYEAV